MEGMEGAVEGAAGGIEAPLELAEGLVVLHAGLAEGKIVFHGEGFLVGIFKELGFGDAEAAEGPLAADEVVEQDAGFRGGGAVALVELVDELLEVGEVLGGEDEGLGMDAGFVGLFKFTTRQRRKNPHQNKRLRRVSLGGLCFAILLTIAGAVAALLAVC